MSYESEGRTESQEREVLTLERPGKTYKIGYVVVIKDDEGHICDHLSLLLIEDLPKKWRWNTLMSRCGENGITLFMV